jgi:chemotaxis methyl-accepting protein methylase
MERGTEHRGQAPTDALVAAVADRLAALCGFRFGEVQRRSLTMAIARRMVALGCGSSAQYEAEVVSSSDEQGEIVDLLADFTNTETHFFRHAGRFRVLREQVAESVIARKGRSGEPIRVLSAGCSSGARSSTLAAGATAAGRCATRRRRSSRSTSSESRARRLASTSAPR